MSYYLEYMVKAVTTQHVHYVLICFPVTNDHKYMYAAFIYYVITSVVLAFRDKNNSSTHSLETSFMGTNLYAHPIGVNAILSTGDLKYVCTLVCIKKNNALRVTQ